MPDTNDQVRAILSTINVTEPSGQWSAWDVARELDPEAHKPRRMFDTPPPYPRDEYVRQAQDAIAALNPAGRYVGGTSGHLYALDPARLAAQDDPRGEADR